MFQLLSISAQVQGLGDHYVYYKLCSTVFASSQPNYRSERLLLMCFKAGYIKKLSWGILYEVRGIGMNSF